ncbi:alpha/beta fold hydrolase [Pseudomonas sp. W4I3]|uniref:alpha/beta fold hydrolase n=1 Tax=Pseudomonas sp. W4I3 TaxID=3042294 RepID=UPI00277DF0C3|nr:alpha/beta fold hydrolase [Pseudomonas sp. W4I3]MDQ0741454.1 pimeloyl-ACP methyl ester carboxylesterase [Pseudomonas sp. W4I3]
MDTQLVSLIQRLANPAVMPMRSAELQQLARMKTEVVTCGAYRSRVLINDTASPQAKSVLLLHGWGGHPMMLCALQSVLHACGYRVYTPFLLGHDPETPAGCELPAQPPLLLMMQARYGAFDSVVAHSAGGIITAMAHSQGFILNQVALLNAPASLANLLQRYLVLHRAAEHYLPLLGADFQRRYPMFADLQTCSPYAFSEARVLIMQGLRDQRISPANARQIQSQLPGSQLHMIEDTGHLGILSHQPALQTLARFLCANQADTAKGNTHAWAH